MAAASAYTTPVNTLDRKDLLVLVRNNILDNSAEPAPDPDVMETESPMRKAQCLQPVTKKLFHSPAAGRSPERSARVGAGAGAARRAAGRARVRRRRLVPAAGGALRSARVRERGAEARSPEPTEGMRRRVLTSLFHNKEYCIECGD